MNILIATHFNLSESLLGAAEMIIGSQKNVKAVTFSPDEGIDALKEKMERVMIEWGGEGLILTDIPGGSPSNVASLLATRYPVFILTGVNLPMLLEILLQREVLAPKELLKTAEEAGKTAIREIAVNK
ncbi:PTS sugar transporter subunit IIA [Aneurinibacillus terranovensis]|uniref:PTS sugar transporter subunit IIA n=1 Tax=Aneurinibacillus terranovensis TaxID=278991 RepID=UPI0005512E7A|nr:PTS sugar transporter subunit IIA [Aneurinibacillus terranovensis]